LWALLGLLVSMCAYLCLFEPVQVLFVLLARFFNPIKVSDHRNILFCVCCLDYAHVVSFCNQEKHENELS